MPVAKVFTQIMGVTRKIDKSKSIAVDKVNAMGKEMSTYWNRWQQQSKC